MVAVVMTSVLRAMKIPSGHDSTKPWDYYVRNDDEAAKVAEMVGVTRAELDTAHSST